MVHAILAFWVFLIGCCFGSFFNVVIYRLPAGESVVHPGSHCPICARELAWFENIPLLSYLIQRGKCRGCGTPIAFRYFIVEGLTGILATVFFMRYGFSARFAAEFCCTCILIIISFIDLDTYIIPDIFSVTGIPVGFAFSFFTLHPTWQNSLLGIAFGGGFFLLIAYSYRWIRGLDGLGGGDIKLLAMIGAFTGWQGVAFTVLAASLSGALAGTWAMRRTRKGMATMIPFGPFLSLGAVCFLLWGEGVVRWYVDGFLNY